MKPDDVDPLYGLKYIAFCRTGLADNEEERDFEGLVVFAKHQVCKVRNLLWNDPVWDSYTPQEILIEFFTIKFDDSKELRDDFARTLVSASKSDIDWMLAQEKKFLGQKNDKIEEGVTKEKTAVIPDEFEDTF